MNSVPTARLSSRQPVRARMYDLLVYQVWYGWKREVCFPACSCSVASSRDFRCARGVPDWQPERLQPLRAFLPAPLLGRPAGPSFRSSFWHGAHAVIDCGRGFYKSHQQRCSWCKDPAYRISPCALDRGRSSVVGRSVDTSGKVKPSVQFSQQKHKRQ